MDAASASFDTSRHLMDSAARLSLKNRVLERLLGLFGGAFDPAQIHTDLLDIAMQAVPCEAASYFHRNAKGELTITAARGQVSEKVIGLRLKKGQGIAGASAQDRRTLPVSDVRSDPRHAAAFTKALGFDTRSLLAVPVTHDGEVRGVIEIINKQGSDEFPRHEIELVERIARAGGDALAVAALRSKGKKR
jgi:Nif-specific regulatory protein